MDLLTPIYLLHPLLAWLAYHPMALILGGSRVTKGPQEGEHPQVGSESTITGDPS